ncbi:MAG: bacteriohemerythrin [Magnetococcus sp. XQGC-1]
MIDQLTYLPESLRLGHLAIDMQHEVLFALYQELIHSLQNEGDGFELSGIFAGLNGYVSSHFQYEEELMRTSRYADSSSTAHTAEHRQLTTDVVRLHQRFASAQGKDEEKAIAQEVATFLANWLSHHIAGTDRLFAAHLIEHPASG